MSECAVSDGLVPCELLAQQDQLSGLEQWRQDAEERFAKFMGGLHGKSLVFFNKIPAESKLIMPRPKVLAESQDGQNNLDVLAGLRKTCRERPENPTQEPTVNDVKIGAPKQIAILFEEARAKIMAGTPDAVKSCVGGTACVFAELETVGAN